MSTDAKLQARIDDLEERLAATEHRLNRTGGFAALYAALAVAVIILCFFPAVDAESADQPFLASPDGLGYVVVAMAAALVAALLTATFAKQLKTLTVPLLIAAFSGIGAVGVLSLGADELTGTGYALSVVLGGGLVTSIAHTFDIDHARTAALEHEGEESSADQ